ncbi:ArnT family glycosyltransferase [Actinomadura rugatobispora]|uniref:ArnT family glycosyltransferase n=1 Tax=Actinomadura rugatobispora TaxID=1994 RepID=A0ABW1A7S6_9ACTN|nr:glycosyltransferase family 39 protein [Actinomadura rugatobispora]
MSTPAGAHAHRPSDERSTVQRLLLGPSDQPTWVRPAALALLALTSLLYLWDLSVSGHGNNYYAAAAMAGSQDWAALFFGSLDPNNGITVDKPPASLWVMGLSGQIFGFSSWSLLVPQALQGIASVGLLYATVRRWSGPAAGLLAGAVFALTPVATSIFRFNKPDSLLTLLLIAAAYCTVRATERAGLRWLLLAGTAIGFGFLTKMLAAFLVLPALALVYLVAAPTGIVRRLNHLGAAGMAVVVSTSWYIALVDLMPKGTRPFIAGSEDDTVLDLALGYNGIGRILGNERNSTSGGAGTGFSGEPGIARMFNDQLGGEISWLLPPALIALIAGLWLTRRAPRTDRTRAAILLWGVWLVGIGMVFSLMEGIILPYYSVILAPAIGALIALAGVRLWESRANLTARCTLAAMVAVSVAWGFALLERTGSWMPGLRWSLLALGVITVIALVAPQTRRLTVVTLACALVTGLGGTSAYALATAAEPKPEIPTSGPAGKVGHTGSTGTRSAVNPELVKAVQATTSRWAAAGIGSATTSNLQLASGKAIMAIGGFSGGDPWPGLTTFEHEVKAGRIHYFVPRSTRADAPSGRRPGRTPGGGAPGNSTAISAWVQANYQAVIIGGQTVYDLTRPRQMRPGRFGSVQTWSSRSSTRPVSGSPRARTT